jgi:hypothetical protein
MDVFVIPFAGVREDVIELMEVGVGLEVLVAGIVADGTGVREGVWDASGVWVGVPEGVLVEVRVDVFVMVGGSPVKVKDPEVFHSLPMNMRTS